ncbi:MAG TPA: hypothetical protein VNT51_03205, partial [Miltoncostaeaceae bacterium]|nr:hypothetical protein [Miltoncostaeaceae bacterium]
FTPFVGARYQLLTGQFAGYRGERDATSPRVGDVFYIRGFVAVVATVSEAPIMSFVFDPALAPDVELAVSAQHPVVCLFHEEISDAGVPDPGNCRQTPEVAGSGGWFFGGRELAPGQAFEVQVPIRVKAVKSGIATGAAAQFGVHVDPALGSPMIASQYLFVAPAPVPAGSPAAGADRVAPRAAALAVRAQGGVRTLRFRLSEPARVGARVERRLPGARARWRTVRTLRPAPLAAGTRTVKVGRLAPGSYRAVLSARDAAGNTGTARVTFRVR